MSKGRALLLLLLLLPLALPASASYKFRHPIPVKMPPPSVEAPAIDWSLGTSVLPEATAGMPYEFNFSGLVLSSEPLKGLSWSSVDLPDWATLDGGNGSLSGTPDAEGEASFAIQVSHSKEGFRQQSYTLIVNGVAITGTQVAAGKYHTCAVTSEEKVLCWGRNDYGQLGNGTNTNSTTPVEVAGLSNVKQVTAGGNTTCALTQSGEAWCWGQRNGFNNGNRQLPSLLFTADQDVRQITMGSDFGCAIVASGAKCWGNGASGRLGHGSTSTSGTPVDVIGLNEVIVSISAGKSHACAVTQSGGLTCWGSNGSGQFGNNSARTTNHTPVSIPELQSGVTQVAAGNQFTCVVVHGSAKCSGLNTSGQLGQGNTSASRVPVDLGLGAGVSMISAGDLHACAIVQGAVKCWGRGAHGRLGSGGTSNSLVPTDVIGLSSGVTSIVASIEHTCAFTQDGIKCWGDNSYGRLGDGNPSGQSAVPIDLTFN